jgi:hypothetical protein
LALLTFTDDTGHDDFVEAVDVALQIEVERLRPGGDANRLDARLVANRANAQIDLLTADAAGRDGNGVLAVRTGRHRDRQLGDVHVGGLQRLPELTLYKAVDDGIPAACLSSCRWCDEHYA